jgi:hypothetical protein
VKRRPLENVALLVLAASACVGPPAPDAAVCRDMIHRICIPPKCSSTAALGLDAGSGNASCEATLQARTGCDSDDFAFTTPSRDRVLECRVPLLHAGKDPEQHPDCLDVDQLITECQDVTRFLQGVQ